MSSILTILNLSLSLSLWCAMPDMGLDELHGIWTWTEHTKVFPLACCVNDDSGVGVVQSNLDYPDSSGPR